MLGNISGFFLLGLTSVQGSRTGTATFTINRAAYGHNGGRLLAFFNWLTLVGWDSSGVALMVIALLTLTHVLGWSISDTAWFKVAVILLVAVVQLSIPALGHATIMVVQKILSWVFVFCFLLVALMLAGKAQLIGGQIGGPDGRTLADLMRSICILLIVLAVGLLIGFRPEGTILNWGAALGLILLINFLFIWFSALLGLLLNSVEAIQQAWMACTLPLLFASNAFVPTNTMPCLAACLRGASTCTGYLVHLFGKSHCKRDKA